MKLFSRKLKNFFILICIFLVLPLVYIFLQGNGDTQKSVTGEDDYGGIKIAFIGDQGLGADAKAVLQLIKDESADMVLHQGDFDYTDDPEMWDRQINDILGFNFPYFASIGNHDEQAWSKYKEKLQARLERIDDATCIGDLGVKSACTYKKIFFILLGVGIMESDHDLYIREQLDGDDSIWRICSWHKDQRSMQVGGKEDEVGWGVYRECRKGGAIIATAHNHSYSRTHLMDSFNPPVIASISRLLQIDKGRSFVFVSGLGGSSIYPQIDELAANDWWAATYTDKNDANYGALFCTFGINGLRDRGHCYFKDIDGEIPDEFDILSNINVGS